MFVCIQIWVKTLDSTSEMQKNIKNIILTVTESLKILFW